MDKKIVIVALFITFMLLALPTISASSIERTSKINIERLKETLGDALHIIAMFTIGVGVLLILYGLGFGGHIAEIFGVQK